MPTSVRRELRKLGGGIATARRRRRLTVGMMLERTGLSKATYAKVEAGDPSASMAAYAMTLFALGLGGSLAAIADPQRDEAGFLFEQERLPKRVRLRKSEIMP